MSTLAGPAAVQTRIATIEARFGHRLRPVDPIRTDPVGVTPTPIDTASPAPAAAETFAAVLEDALGTAVQSPFRPVVDGRLAPANRVGTLPLTPAWSPWTAPIAPPSSVPVDVPSTGEFGERVVELARRYLGIPYVFGSADPARGLDCSGLTKLVFSQLGVQLPHWSRAQSQLGIDVPSLAQAQPGDLLFFHRPVSHVAIYVGDGQQLHAPRSGDVVKISPVDVDDLVAIRRIGPVGGRSPAAPASPTGPAAPTAPTDPAGPAPLDPNVPYAELFTAAAEAYDLSPALLAAVAYVESGFDPTVVSSAGAQGLMQLMPEVARELGVANPFDPAQAIDGAARLLRSHLDRFGTAELALAAYNAGPGAVARAGGVPSPGVRRYVDKVLYYAGMVS